MGLFSSGVGRVGLGIATGGISEIPGVRDYAGGVLETFNPKIPGVDQYDPNRENFQTDNSGFNQRFDSQYNNPSAASNQAYQTQLFGDLQSRVAGNKPSVAENQFAQSLDQLRAQQASQAASQGGYNPGAQRAAAYNTAQIGQQGAGQAATLRAQEQSTAEQLFANALNQARGQDFQKQLGYEQLGLGRDQLTAQGNQAYEESLLRRYFAQIGAQQDAYSRQTQGVGAILGAGGSVGAAAASDINLKMDIRSGDHSIEEFLNEISAFEYKYKKGDGKDKLGVMAQDLEKSKLGKQMVFETDEGKMVDYGQGFSAMMAAIAYLNDKVKKVEGK